MHRSVRKINVPQKRFASRVDRVVQLLPLLQGGSDGRPEVLARLLGVSKRTIYRDFASLQEAGIRVDFQPEARRYRVAVDQTLVPAQLGRWELALLAAAVCSSPLLEDPELHLEVKQALARVMGRADAGSRASASRIAQAVLARRRTPETLAPQTDTLRTVLEAIGQDGSLRIVYRHPSRVRNVRTRIKPKVLAFVNDEWTIRGRSSVHRRDIQLTLGQLVTVEVIPRELDDLAYTDVIAS